MIQITDLSLQFGPLVLFQDISLKLRGGEKVGIVGRNGCGKSTLFSVLLKRLESDSGSCVISDNAVVAHVSQHLDGGDRQALEFVLDGDNEFRQIQSALEKAEKDDNHSALAELHERMAQIDGYAANARGARLLNGLGFSNDDLQRPAQAFSGGWQVRLNLAQALMCRSDILLLDEPTNHLDLDAVVWLEGWLQRYPGLLVMISHDRDFLDAITRRTLHVHNTNITSYAGNYSFFELQRAEKIARDAANASKQAKQIAHLEQFITRFKAKATKAKQAQSRVKQLEKIQRIAPAHTDNPFRFKFFASDRVSDPLMVLDNVDLGYGDTPILKKISLSLLSSQRIGVLGRNGAGKSTLIQALSNQLLPQAGQITGAKHLKIGYFAQHQLSQLNTQNNSLETMQLAHPEIGHQVIRDYLGGFGFTAQRVEQKIAEFSGGERARLVLALLIYQRPNLLLLDEPTNHLDLEMRFSLTMALQEFSGCLVVISHDRHLLSSVTDQLWLVDAGKVSDFEGDLASYMQWLTAQRQSTGEDAKDPNKNPNNDKDQRASTNTGDQANLNRKEQRQAEAEKRQRQQPIRNRLRRIEKDMDQLTKKLSDINTQLEDPSLYEGDKSEQITLLMTQKSDQEIALAEAEHQWLQLSEELEA